MTKTAEVERWLIDGARTAATPQDVLLQMCEVLVTSGVPLGRAAVFVKTIHPMVMGRSFTWKPGEGVRIGQAPVGFEASDTYRNSPAGVIAETKTTIRRKLSDPTTPIDFPVLKELLVEGATDYLAVPLLFSNGEVHAATFSTTTPGGFGEDDISGLVSVVVPLTRIAEIWALRRVATNVLNTYVGRQAGAQVLAGKILRGDAETIEAVIWLTDIRGSTVLADRVAPLEYVAILNRYFDAQVPSITEHGGEVLKYIGDSLLAIFPTGKEAGAPEACQRAVRAVRTARKKLAEDLPELGFGIALHMGEVLYGNIGSGDRLDFTCIGPTVNLAARLEKLSATVGRSVVASGAVARHDRDAFDHLGEHELPGFVRTTEVYGLKDDPMETAPSVQGA